MMTQEPFVSIVTPVYNTAEYLPACIESVLRQSYQNFEYLILNNCSTDASRDIALSYAKRDARIRVVDNPALLPQASNYNRALQLIAPSSRYTKMVQADDWIFPDCVQELVQLAETDPQLAIVGAYQLAGAHVKCQGLECQDGVRGWTRVSGREACRLFLLRKRYVFGTPTSLLYRSDLVRSRTPFFREDTPHEDSEVCFEVLHRFDFGFVHKILAYTRIDNVSLSTTVQDFNPDALHAFIVVNRYGRLYLTEEECRECVRRLEDELYDVLAQGLFKRRGDRYWAYQESGFKIAGSRLNWPRVWWRQIPRVMRWLGNPWRIGERIYGMVMRPRV